MTRVYKLETIIDRTLLRYIRKITVQVFYFRSAIYIFITRNKKKKKESRNLSSIPHFYI